jgi:hypothetical protein
MLGEGLVWSMRTGLVDVDTPFIGEKLSASVTSS